MCFLWAAVVASAPWPGALPAPILGDFWVTHDNPGFGDPPRLRGPLAQGPARWVWTLWWSVQKRRWRMGSSTSVALGVSAFGPQGRSPTEASKGFAKDLSTWNPNGSLRPVRKQKDAIAGVSGRAWSSGRLGCRKG